jgi:hypothetical protein
MQTPNFSKTENPFSQPYLFSNFSAAWQQFHGPAGSGPTILHRVFHKIEKGLCQGLWAMHRKTSPDEKQRYMLPG